MASTNSTPSPARKAHARRRFSSSGASSRAYSPGPACGSVLAGARSSREPSHGVTRKATTVLVITATGTLKAMGDMYGPIMPVMKLMGANTMTMARVDISSGMRISIMAATTASLREA